MKYTALALLGLAATSYADEGSPVTALIKPKGEAPSGCSPDCPGQIQIEARPILPTKRDVIQKRSSTCNSDKTLVMTLKAGVLVDAKDRTGYIASNFQFQFDGPAQSGAIYTGGFSYCTNGSLALGSSTVFYRCRSGDFYNLYDRHWAEQCEPIEMVALPCDEGGADSNNDADGASLSVVGTSTHATTMVKVLSDGQPEVVSTNVAIPMCQIGDGQVQAHTTPCASAPVPHKSPAQQPSATAAPPVPISEIHDGQPQVPASALPPPALSEIHSPQPEAPSPQPQAPSNAPAPAPASPSVASQASEASPEANPSTNVAPAPPPVTKTSEAQPQTPKETNPPASTAAAVKQFPALAAAVLGAALAF